MGRGKFLQIGWNHAFAKVILKKTVLRCNRQFNSAVNVFVGILRCLLIFDFRLKEYLVHSESYF